MDAGFFLLSRGTESARVSHMFFTKVILQVAMEGWSERGLDGTVV